MAWKKISKIITSVFSAANGCRKDMSVENKMGVKSDQEKLRYDLLPPEPIEEMVAVLTFGAKKYSDDNWKKVPDAKRRYYAALMRHLEAWRMGETHDGESDFHHLAHALCCLTFLTWFEVRK